jgi:hypothetical protein
MHLQVICLGIMKYLLVVLDRALDAPDPPKGGEGGGLVHLSPWVRGLGALGPHDPKQPLGAATRWHLGMLDSGWVLGDGTH